MFGFIVVFMIIFKLLISVIVCFSFVHCNEKFVFWLTIVFRTNVMIDQQPFSIFYSACHVPRMMLTNGIYHMLVQFCLFPSWKRNKKNKQLKMNRNNAKIRRGQTMNTIIHLSPKSFGKQNTSISVEWAATRATPSAVVSWTFVRTGKSRNILC